MTTSYARTGCISGYVFRSHRVDACAGGVRNMRGGVVVAAVVVLSCEGIAVAPRVSEAIRVSEVPLEYQRILL